jgi:hypothetical protein
MPIRRVAGLHLIGEFVADRAAKRGSFCHPPERARWQKPRSHYGAGAGVEAFQRSTIAAVVVLSVFLKPGTGSFEYRSR